MIYVIFRVKMGKVLSTVTKPLRNFAVEARAHKVISQDKPKPAPWHPSVEKQVEAIKQNIPGLSELLGEKDELLNKRLKDVYVTSDDIAPKKLDKGEGGRRSLPHRKNVVESPEYGFEEPERVPMGKITIRQALHMLGDCHKNSVEPQQLESLAHKYNIDLEKARNIVKYFRMFELHMPANTKKNQLSSKDGSKFLKMLPASSKPESKAGSEPS